MTLSFQDLIDITIDSIQNYSESHYSSEWHYNIEEKIYLAIKNNDRNILNSFNPYQLNAMIELINKNYWIYYDNDINHPVIRQIPLFDDRIPLKNGSD